MTLTETTGQDIKVTNWDYSATHFEGQYIKGKLKGRTLVFLKARPYTTKEA